MNKMQILEQIDRKIIEEFKTYNIEYPLFLSCLTIINKIFLLNNTFKRGQYGENKKKITELLSLCNVENNSDFTEKMLGHIKTIHDILDEIF